MTHFLPLGAPEPGREALSPPAQPPRRARFSRLDPLTRLPNRLGLRGAFGKAPGPVALVELSVLGEVNAQHGCLEGDRLLRWVSDGLTRELHGPTVGRWGGNAFVVIFPEATSTHRAALTLAEALGPLVTRRYRAIGQAEVEVSFTTALASPGEDSTLDEVVALAAPL